MQSHDVGLYHNPHQGDGGGATSSSIFRACHARHGVGIDAATHRGGGALGGAPGRQERLLDVKPFRGFPVKESQRQPHSNTVTLHYKASTQSICLSFAIHFLTSSFLKVKSCKKVQNTQGRRGPRGLASSGSRVSHGRRAKLEGALRARERQLDHLIGNGTRFKAERTHRSFPPA